MSSFNATLAATSLSNVQQTRPEPRASMPVKLRATDAISMFFSYQLCVFRQFNFDQKIICRYLIANSH